MQPKAKILHFAPSANLEYGGPIQGIANLHIALREHFNIHTSVLTVTQSNISPALSDIRVYQPGTTDSLIGGCIKQIQWLHQTHASFDTFIVNGLWQPRYIPLLLYLHFHKRPYIVFPHGMLDHTFKKLYPFKHAKKLLYWLLIERWHLKRAARVVFTCETELELFLFVNFSSYNSWGHKFIG